MVGSERASVGLVPFSLTSSNASLSGSTEAEIADIFATHLCKLVFAQRFTGRLNQS